MKVKLPDFKSAKVIVFGDVMLDRYWYGDTSRISPEAPVPVVHINHVEERPGGAGNVALNISSLGASVSLYSMSGADEVADILEHKLAAAGVKPFFHRVTNMPTVTKLRILSLNQQLIRLDFEERFHEVSNHDLVSHCVNEIAQAKTVVLSDYGKGGIQDAQMIIQAARKAKVPVLVDPKSKDFSQYDYASVITPNMKEFEAVVGECPDEAALTERGFNLIKAHHLSALLITRGARGMTLLEKQGTVLHLPTQAKEVYDVTGAGDTVIGVFAACLATGLSFEHATVIANAAAGIVVGKVGAATVTVPELLREAQGKVNNNRGVVNEDRLFAMVHDAQKHGDKVVMTNGCFDILHSGHVMYLEQAKALGNKLIVAVNDDDSVRRLKGSDRPINSLERRMDVLAGLQAVDWVVPFSEDTPERLICKILPDVLVKGGDWQIDQIAGADCVLKHGGKVKVLGFEEGISTSEIVKKIRSKRGE